MRGRRRKYWKEETAEFNGITYSLSKEQRAEIQELSRAYNLNDPIEAKAFDYILREVIGL